MRSSVHWRWILVATAGSLLAVGALAAEAVAPLTPADPIRYEWEATSVLLWKVGGGATPLSYRLMPQILSLRIPPINTRPWWGGTLVYRTRLSLLLEPIVSGPEDYFFGAAAAGELQWRDAKDRFGCFFAGGGGFGWMNSKGYQVAGAQGQDFNLNWLLHAGLNFRTKQAWQYSVGLYFQHISNRGMNKVNPGLNALGPSLGISRRF